jgi:Tol biopolymer transport system component
MTSVDRFERHLPELMADLASARVPDYLDDILQVTARTRQRPAWASLERWLPVDLALPQSLGRARLAPRLVLLALVGLLAAVALLAYAGSRQHRLPAPFGPAANGSLYFNNANGDVIGVDPVTMAAKTLITATPGTRADGVIASRNGLLVATGAKVTGGEQLSVADADGSNLRVLPGTWINQSEIDWSPTDTQLAVVSEVAGVPSISILPVDGSASRSLNLGLEVHNLWYLPDGRLVFHGASGSTYGIYVVNADGSGLKTIGQTSTVDNWLGLVPSEDGTRIAYHKWVDAPLEHGRLHLVDVASGADTTINVAGSTGSDEFEEPIFSPDGKSILFKWFSADQNVRLAMIPVGGGAAVRFGPAVHYDVSPLELFSPDGNSVIAWYPSLKQLWLLDPTGNASADKQLALSVSDVPTWQRLAP